MMFRSMLQKSTYKIQAPPSAVIGFMTVATGFYTYTTTWNSKQGEGEGDEHDAQCITTKRRRSNNRSILLLANTSKNATGTLMATSEAAHMMLANTAKNRTRIMATAAASTPKEQEVELDPKEKLADHGSKAPLKSMLKSKYHHSPKPSQLRVPTS